MEVITLIAWSFAGGICWLFHAETTAIALGAAGGWHPLTIALCCAGGQSLSYVFLFFCGDWLFARWRWWRQQVDRTEQKYGARLQKSFYALTAPAALVGVPPMTGMAALSGGFRVRLLPFIAIAFSLRLVHFFVLATAGSQLVAWWRALW